MYIHRNQKLVMHMITGWCVPFMRDGQLTWSKEMSFRGTCCCAFDIDCLLALIMVSVFEFCVSRDALLSCFMMMSMLEHDEQLQRTGMPLTSIVCTLVWEQLLECMLEMHACTNQKLWGRNLLYPQQAIFLRGMYASTYAASCKVFRWITGRLAIGLKGM